MSHKKFISELALAIVKTIFIIPLALLFALWMHFFVLRNPEQHLFIYVAAVIISFLPVIIVCYKKLLPKRD